MSGSLSPVLSFFLCSLLFVLAFGCYLNVLHGELAFDDGLAVSGNADTNPDNDVWQLFKHDFWGADITSDSSHKSYRPITTLSFRATRTLNRRWYGADSDLDPFLFHVWNTILHSIATILTFFVAKHLFSLKMCATSKCAGTRQVTIMAIIASLMFAVHPAHTEAVSGIVGCGELICTVFYLIGFLLWTNRWRDNGRSRLRVWGSTFFAFCSFVVAVFSKENGITLLGLLFIYDVVRSLALYSPMKRQNYPNIFRGLMIPFGLLLSAGLGYIAVRISLAPDALGVGHQVSRHVENPIAHSEDRTTRVLSAMYLYFRYLKILIYPDQLCADYSFNCIPLVESMDDQRALYGIGTVLLILPPCLCALGVYILRNKEHENKKVSDFCLVCDSGHFLFCMAWLIVPFLPAANIFFYVGTMIAERLLYIPSIGLCFFFGFLVVKVYEALSKVLSPTLPKFLLTLIVLAISGKFAERTYLRNQDWESEEKLFLSALEVCPDSVKVLQNVGILYRRTQEWDTALSYYYRVKEVDPTFCEVDYWIGLTKLNRGKTYDALPSLKSAIKCKFSAVNAATALQRIYEALIQMQPNNATLLQEWGGILVLAEQQDGENGAVGYFLRAGLAFEKEKQYVRAKNALLQSFKLIKDTPSDPLYCTVAFWYGKLSVKTKKYKSGVPVLKDVISMTECQTFKLYALDSLAGYIRPKMEAGSTSGLFHEHWAFLMLHLGQSGGFAEAAKYYNSAANLYQKQGKLEDSARVEGILKQMTLNQQTAEVDVHASGRTHQ